MIRGIGRSGDGVASLLQDVYDSGRGAEDLATRIVAGWRPLAELEPPVRADGGRDFRPLAGLMEMPLAALGDRAPDNPVWHCRLRAAPQDRPLVARWVGAARGMLGDAPNYTETEVDLGLADPPGVEMTVGLPGEERFVFRLQRRGKLTPHQARMRAEERAEAAEAVLAALRDLIPPERFRDMAAWFDTDDEFKTAMFPGTRSPDSRGRETQDDLRAFAELLDVAADKP